MPVSHLHCFNIDMVLHLPKVSQEGTEKYWLECYSYYFVAGKI